jgi:hypothetical protein
MRQQCYIMILLLAGMTLTGCGNFYTLTAPDQVAAIGTESPVVVRLQQNDMFMIRMPAKNQPVRFRIGDGLERNVHTDDEGYAATLVISPDTPGRYILDVRVSDFEGDEVEGQAGFYAWDTNTPIVAVDADCLPAWNPDAAEAITRFARSGMEIIYLTRTAPLDHNEVHLRLEMRGYPDGPVLSWERQFYRVERVSRYRVNVKVDRHLVSQLPQLRKMFPNLKAGVGDSNIASQAFAEAGMVTYLIGHDRVPEEYPVVRTDWIELARPQGPLPGQD